MAGLGKKSRFRQGRKRSPLSWQLRDYQSRVVTGELVSFRVCIGESDLLLLAERDARADAEDLLLRCRLQLESYIQKNPVFLSSLVPLPLDPLAPRLVREMLQAGHDAGVGPMAAVAGTLAAYVGEGLLATGIEEIIVENGGDIYLRRSRECTVAIFAGESPLSNTIGLRIEKAGMPCGVCTSSGTVGHSLSFGDADSVTVVAHSVALADAAATRLGNEVGRGRRESDKRKGVEQALAAAKTIAGLQGVVVICDDVMGAAGDIELVRL